MRTQVWLGTLLTLPSWPHLTEALVVSQSIGRSSRGSPGPGRGRSGWSDRGVLEVDGAAADGHRVAGGVEHEVGLRGDLDGVRSDLEVAAVLVLHADGVRPVVDDDRLAVVGAQRPAAHRAERDAVVGQIGR